MNNNIFNPKRFLLLIKNDLVMCQSVIITSLATIGGILLLYNLIFPNNIMQINSHPTGFTWLLFIGGVWVSSLGFKNAHDKQSNYFFLMLPCSTFEKFFDRMILTSIVYALVILIFYTLFYWAIAGFNLILFRENYFFILTPFLPETWNTIWLYIVIHSVFLLGSIYFKKHSIIKTVLVITCIGIILSLFMLLLSKIFLHSLIIGNTLFAPNLTNTGSVISYALRFLFWIALAPFCWIVSYFRLKEIEV